MTAPRLKPAAERAVTPNLVTAADLALWPDEYAMGVVGNCMDPEIPDGVFIHVDKSLPVGRGDLVVVWTRPETVPIGRAQAIVKRLVLSVPPGVIFPHKDHPQSEILPVLLAEQINPRRQYSIRCADVIGLHRCLGLLSADRVREKVDVPKSFTRSRKVKTLRALNS